MEYILFHCVDDNGSLEMLPGQKVLFKNAAKKINRLKGAEYGTIYFANWERLKNRKKYEKVKPLIALQYLGDITLITDLPIKKLKMGQDQILTETKECIENSILEAKQNCEDLEKVLLVHEEYGDAYDSFKEWIIKQCN